MQNLLVLVSSVLPFHPAYFFGFIFLIMAWHILRKEDTKAKERAYQQAEQDNIGAYLAKRARDNMGETQAVSEPRKVKEQYRGVLFGDTSKMKPVKVMLTELSGKDYNS